MPQNDQIWPKIGIFGQFGPGHAGLFNALLWVGWWLWRMGCISQDTYLLYFKIFPAELKANVDARAHQGAEVETCGVLIAKLLHAPNPLYLFRQS